MTLGCPFCRCNFAVFDVGLLWAPNTDAELVQAKKCNGCDKVWIPFEDAYIPVDLSKTTVLLPRDEGVTLQKELKEKKTDMFFLMAQKLSTETKNRLLNF